MKIFVEALMERLRCWWPVVLDFVFPHLCIGCRDEGAAVCSQCFGAMERAVIKAALWEKLEKTGQPALDGVLACSSYHGLPLMSRSVHAFKYDFVKDLAVPLGWLLATAFLEYKEKIFEDNAGKSENILITFVPLHRKRKKWRGFNQAELLARVMSDVLRDCGVGAELCDVLARNSFTKAQMELERDERFGNVEGVFEVMGSQEAQKLLRGRTIFLVDDVATTLATALACAKALKNHGAERVFVIVLARSYL